MAYQAAGDDVRADDIETAAAIGSDFGRRLRAARVAAGFATARQFAHALDLAENRYTRYERGETEPALGTIARMCRVLRVTPDQLLGFVDSEDIAASMRAGFADAPPEVSASHGDDARLIAGRRRWLCWQLALECAANEAIGRAMGHDRLDSIPRLRRTCDLFRQIERDPCAFIVKIVEGAAVDDLPPERQQSLAIAIDALSRCASMAGVAATAE